MIKKIWLYINEPYISLLSVIPYLLCVKAVVDDMYIAAAWFFVVYFATSAISRKTHTVTAKEQHK